MKRLKTLIDRGEISVGMENPMKGVSFSDELLTRLEALADDAERYAAGKG